MNYLKTIFIGALVACIAMLGIVLLAGRRLSAQSSKPKPFHRSLDQLRELGRTKYQQSLRYLAYAHYAERDSLHEVASLFHAISHADAIHNANCRHAIEALGGKFTYPIISPTQFSSTTSHLQKALYNKATTHNSQMPLYIEQALSDNNLYIARMLTWCDASDVKQIILLQEILGSTAAPHRHIYKVCPTCGDITWEEIATRHCPKCMTDSTQFIVIEHVARHKNSSKQP